jgi:myo-inositol-1(or 4)-monophosphatase
MASPRTTAPDGTDVAALEDLATRVAVAAGRLVVDQRPGLVEASATKSSPTDIVTVMDTRAEELIRELLLAERPDDGVLGEEGDDHRGSSGITWVVDPIDGTVNYLYDIPAYAVSVAAAVGNPTVPGEWEVLAGAVADPALGRVYHAAAGSGAYERDWEGTEGTVASADGRRLAVGTADELSGALVGTGFGYTPERRLAQAQALLAVLPRVRDIRRMGSAALDLCSVACGRLDAFYESGLNPWDMAAGWLILTEAGGVVTGPQGGPPSAAMTVAGNPAVAAQLLTVLDGLDPSDETG